MDRRSLLKSAALSPLVLHEAWASTAAADVRPPLLQEPDLVRVQTGDTVAATHDLAHAGGEWRGAGAELRLRIAGRETAITLSAPGVAVQRLHLRWKSGIGPGARVVGDAWERSYGDLAWLPVQAERVLPWYCLVEQGDRTSGFGVKAGAAALAFWQVDPEGISLWLDVRNGGDGVRLGGRELTVATTVSEVGAPGETSFAVSRRLCEAMTRGMSVPGQRGGRPLDAIFGSNDWYYAYGHNTPQGILRDADLMRELAPAGRVRPFTVIDDGYQDHSRFPSMERLAEQIKQRDVVPGVWIRPLRASATTKHGMLLPAARFRTRAGEEAPPAYDPTVPEGMASIVAVVREACGWGYELIKHDFSTFEFLGQWGSQMGASPAIPGWHCNDQTRTNAEILSDLYREIRRACGEERIVLGCNTVGHLAVGLFDAQRTGDDVSGMDWERTRRMGVNTLAFRLPQHGTFFRLDADCVPVTPKVSWQRTEQWLRVVAESGTVLLVSPDPAAVGDAQKRALREAFAICAGRTGSEPLDWKESRTPERWRERNGMQRYEWLEAIGASPFSIGVALG